MSDLPVDIEMAQAMDVVFDLTKADPSNTYTDDQIRRKIVCSNLHALCNTLLLADSNPDQVGVDLKKVVLGILGTAEWLVKGLDGN